MIVLSAYRTWVRGELGTLCCIVFIYAVLQRHVDLAHVS
jgi:hypothetical protein